MCNCVRKGLSSLFAHWDSSLKRDAGWAGMLGERGAEDVPPQLHRELLCHLCNESLDRDPLRALLSARMENAEGVKKEMREAAAGDKGKIKACCLSLFQYLSSFSQLMLCTCFFLVEQRFQVCFQ